MKQYKHKRTGAIISVNSEISGDWELFEAPKAETPAEAKPKKASKKKGKEQAEKPEEPTVTPEENAEGNQGEGEEA